MLRSTMKTQAVIDHFGSVAKVAETLGISDKAVYAWGEDVPALRAYQLERLTEGELAVGDNPPEDAA